MFKNYRYRVNVVKEIISTEQGYVNDLNIIVNHIKVILIDSQLVTSAKV
jgi:GTP:adenosylcobinamide-phosphate guanylyltransferase